MDWIQSLYSAISLAARPLWLLVGVTALGLGALGAFLPVLPTVPFVILAAFAFGKSVPRWQTLLEKSETFGPAIRDWRAHGAIAPRYKIWAGAMMLGSLLLSLAMSVGSVILVVQTVCMAAAFAYVVSRPNGPV